MVDTAPLFGRHRMLWNSHPTSSLLREHVLCFVTPEFQVAVSVHGVHLSPQERHSGAPVQFLPAHSVLPPGGFTPVGSAVVLWQCL